MSLSLCSAFRLMHPIEILIVVFEGFDSEVWDTADGEGKNHSGGGGQEGEYSKRCLKLNSFTIVLSFCHS